MPSPSPNDFGKRFRRELTPKQKVLALFLLEGKSIKEIAAIADRPYGSLKTAMTLMFQRVGVQNRLEFVHWYVKRFGGNNAKPLGTPESPLTAGESIAVDGIACGWTDKEIADYMHSTRGSVKVMLSRVYKKTGCRNRVELMLRKLAW